MTESSPKQQQQQQPALSDSTTPPTSTTLQTKEKQPEGQTESTTAPDLQSQQKQRGLSQQKLFELQQRLNQARKRNIEALKAEVKKESVAPEAEAKRYRFDQAQRVKKTRQEVSKDEDDPTKWVLDISAEQAARTYKKPPKDSFGWQVFDDDCQRKAYERRIDQADNTRGADVVKEEYAKQKKEIGEAIYGDRDSLLHGTPVPVKPEAADRLVTEMEKAASKAKQYSRRRRHYEGTDITYINERNASFNRKLSRAYDAFTSEIRQNLERGTAL